MLDGKVTISLILRMGYLGYLKYEKVYAANGVGELTSAVLVKSAVNLYLSVLVTILIMLSI